jgi:hypothetical protein
MSFQRTARVIASLVLLTCCCHSQDEKPWQFPTALRPQMDEQLKLFMTSQADGRWDVVGRLLGDYRRGNVGYMRYTPAHKECLLDAMRPFPMTAFDFQIDQSSFSSEILSTPPNRRWWTLVGEATFQTASGPLKRQWWLLAYRDGDGWFFTPPPVDNAVLGAVTAQELAMDRSDAVKIRIPSDAPLEIVDLHVHLDPKYLTSRNIEFRFRNKTDKRIKEYSFVIDDDLLEGEEERGSISVGTGAERDAIMPFSDSRVWKESDSRFLYRCEGERDIRITLEDVTFEDDTRWELKKSEPKKLVNKPPAQ